MIKLVISIVICQCAGAIGALFTRRSIPGWYQNIKKPFFNPPDWIFAPVWTTLFALMGIAAYLIWRKGLHTSGVKNAMAIFLLQLLLNILWSALFFGCRSIGGALVVIVLLWLAILWTMVTFFSLSMAAFLLIGPYIIWVSFAVILNIALLVLNK